MRFIFLSQGYHPDIDGGAYRYAAEVAELLAARGHEVHALAKNPDNGLEITELRRGVRLYRINGTGGGLGGNWREINREARLRVKRLLHDSNDATLVASHHAYFEAAIRGLEKVCFLHGPWALEHQFNCESRPRSFGQRLRDAFVIRTLRKAERRILAASRQILVASEYVERSLAAWHPGLRVPTSVVGGGVNHARFVEVSDRAALRTRWGVAPGDFLLLAVRRLDPRMGLSLLVEAFGRVAARHAQARLWIAGKGPQQTELEQRAANAGLADRVRLLGFVPEPDLPGLYAAADAVVMPSLDLEGFGLVTAEAMACGTPVLASKAGANGEVVGPFDARLLFEAGSEPLAALLDQILSGALQLPERRRAAEHARQHFRFDRAADAFEVAWDEFSIPPEIPDRK